MNSIKSPSLNIAYCLIQFIYWTCGCIAIGFASAFLGKIGYSNSSIGLISAISSVLGFILMLSVSQHVDKNGGHAVYSSLMTGISVQAAALLLVFIIRIPCIAVSISYIVFMSITHIINTLISKLYMDLKEIGFEINFGIARGLGSLGYAMTSIFAGSLLMSIHPIFMLFICLCLFLILLSISLYIRKNALAQYNIISAPGCVKRADGLSLSNFIMSYKSFVFLVIGISLVSASNKTLTVFLVNIVDGVGGNARHFGIISAYLALIEVPVSFLFSNLKKRYSVSLLLFFSMVFYTLKITGYTFAGSFGVLIAASSLQAFSTGIYQPSAVEYVRENIPYNSTALAQSLMTGLPLLFSFISTVVFGFLLDKFSVSHVLPFTMLLAILGTAICLVCLLNRKKPRQNN
ncbi:MAG: MFS transporter [Oscillospiraceae bacterium]|nr:MFS transporter [Oscillospiraceae bacterium]